jgi:hypothetical protein
MVEKLYAITPTLSPRERERVGCVGKLRII